MAKPNIGWWLCPLIAIALGCGSDVVTMIPVKGELKVDGKPVSDVDVQLQPVDANPKSMVALGRTNKEGKFVVSSSNGKKGAVKGKYRIVLAPPESQSAVTEIPGASNVPPKMMLEYTKNYAKQQSPELMARKNAKAKDGPIPKEYLKKETSPRSIEVVDKPLEIEIDI